MKQYLLLCAFFAILFSRLHAQECREMNEAEKTAYQKLRTALAENIEVKLQNEQWEISGTPSPEHLTVALSPMPVRPLMFCQHFYNAMISLKPSSAQYAQLKDSADYYLNGASNQPGNQALKWIKKSTSFTSQATYSITIAENVPTYYLQEPGSAKMVLRYNSISVPGAALALQIWYKGSEPDDEPVQETVLCLGKWKDNLVKNASARWYYPFSFSHPKGTPFIENIVVTIHASAQKAAQTIKQIDWQKIKEGLTE